MSAGDLANLVNRLETVATKLESVMNIHNGSSPIQQASLSPFVLAYDNIINGPLQKFLALSNSIGGEIKLQASMIDNAFKAQRNFLVLSSRSKEPPQNVLISFLHPTSSQIQTIQDFREKNRASSLFNHLSAISESISALGWVTVAPTPGPYVKEMMDAGQFYSNRVLVDYKDKDKTHIEWVRTWLQVLNELQSYIKQFHTTGLSWNPQGGDMTAASPSVPNVGPPAPPPPPPADFFSGAGDTQENDIRAALFKDINRGSDITKGLKRVEAEQMTHKNPNLRSQPNVPCKMPPTTARPFKPYAAASATTKPVKPPKLELEGKKWCVDYQVGNKGIVISETEMNQSVVLYQCVDSLVVVKGKINSITVDSCRKTSVVFDDIVAMVEFINCQSVQAQSMGKVPTITVDKTDGAQIFLSPKSLDVEIVSSKSSELNVSVPQADGDFIELPVPEQFKSTVSGKTLKTVVIEKN